MFQVFLTYVTSVLSRCCICCTSYISMLQAYISNVFVVLNVCCKCFIWMLHMLQRSYTYVASICFKYFICFGRMLQQMLYVASVPFHEQAQEGAQAEVVPSGAGVQRSLRARQPHMHVYCSSRSVRTDHGPRPRHLFH
jgi:hypothetical protein